MKGLKNKIICFNFIVLFLALISTAPSQAALNIEMKAGQEGLSIQYDRGFPSGSKEIVLVPGDPMKIIFAISHVVRLEAMITNVVPEEHKIEIRAKISSRFFQEGAIEVPLAIPFGSFGLYAHFRGHQFINPEHHDIEVSVLLSKSHVRYAAAVDLGELFYGQWEGTATPFDNAIHESIINPADGNPIAEFDLTLKYVSKFFTVIQYDISLTPLVNDRSSGVEETQNPQTLNGIILLPNGFYHLWADFDFMQQE